MSTITRQQLWGERRALERASKRKGHVPPSEMEITLFDDDVIVEQKPVFTFVDYVPSLLVTAFLSVLIVTFVVCFFFLGDGIKSPIKEEAQLTETVLPTTYTSEHFEVLDVVSSQADGRN